MLLWHPAVHEHFDEELFYFLIGVISFKANAFETLSKRLREDLFLTGFCIYPALGSYDIVLRVWLNRVDLRALSGLLDELCESGEFGNFLAFRAARIEHWPFHGSPSAEVDAYTPEDYLNAQDGDVSLQEDMQTSGLLHRGPISEPGKLKFYIAVGAIPNQFGTVEAVIYESVKAAIPKDGRLEKISFYEGSGFCSLLAKGVTRDVDTIFEVATAVREVVSGYQMLSHTFLVSTSDASESDRINRSSLLGLPRFERTCMAWVPEMYDLDRLASTDKAKIRQAEDLILSARVFHDLGEDREWMQGTLVPLVHEERSTVDRSFVAARRIGSKLAMVEHWLRTNLNALLRGLASDDDGMKSLLSATEIPKDRQGSLSQWLKGYSQLISRDEDCAARLAYTTETEELFNRVTEIRNDCDHTDGQKTVQRWQDTLVILNRFFPVFHRIQELASTIIIARTTRQETEDLVSSGRE